MKRVFTVLFLVVCISTLVFAGGVKDTAAQERSKTVTLAISENPVTLDPHYKSNLGTVLIWDTVFDTLVEIDEDENGNYSYLPNLATSWSSNDAGTEWTFNLRKGVKFHNGEDFTAADCAATYQRILDNPTFILYTTYWTTLDGYEVIDDYTFKLILRDPLPTILIGAGKTAIIPDEAYAKYGKDLFDKQLMYGTGPWMFDSWVDGQFMSFKKNENYWNKANYDSYFDNLKVMIITEESTGISALLAGDIDNYARTTGYSMTNVPLFSGRKDIELISKDLQLVLYFGMQCKEGAVFNNPKLREAFSLAINRQEIVDFILERGSVANGILVKGVNGHDPSMPIYEYNPERAKALVKEGGYDGTPIMLSSNTGTPQADEILPVVAEMLNKVGFKASSQILESATLLDMRVNHNYDVYLVNYQFSGGDPSAYLVPRVMNDYHGSTYANPEINSRIDAMNKEMDPAKRTQLLKEVNRLIQDNFAPFIPVAASAQTLAQRKGITGVIYGAAGLFRFRYVDWDPTI